MVEDSALERTSLESIPSMVGLLKDKSYGGPRWEFLSESLQLSLMNYLYSLGVRPDIGICVEYLSWNREQRLYV